MENKGNKINNEGLKYLLSNNALNLKKARENIKKRLEESRASNQKHRLNRLLKVVNLIKQGKKLGLNSDEKFYNYITREIGCNLDTARGLIRRVFFESMTEEQIMERDSLSKYKKSTYSLPILEITLYKI